MARAGRTCPVSDDPMNARRCPRTPGRRDGRARESKQAPRRRRMAVRVLGGTAWPRWHLAALTGLLRGRRPDRGWPSTTPTRSLRAAPDHPVAGAALLRLDRPGA